MTQKKKQEEIIEQSLDQTQTKESSKVSEIQDLTDTCKRLQADFENYKKRVENDRQQSIDFGAQKVISAILPVLDSMSQALKNCKDEKEKEGLAMLNAQLISSLEPFGLRVIELGERFDANRHEAVMAVESDKDEHSIIEEIQKGYMVKNKVFRHSKVIVSKGKNDNKEHKAE